MVALGSPTEVDMRPEAELLLCCARVPLDPTAAARVEALLKTDVDWDYVLQAASSHGMIPLLYWHLRAICPDAVPEPTLERLRDWFHDNARRNLFLASELIELLALLETHGIAAISYKGPTLAASAYGNVALRDFCDLDILVRERDVERASELLASRGYRYCPPLPLTRAQDAVFRRSQCALLLAHEDGIRIVDLHWELTRRNFACPLDPERWWGRLHHTRLAGTTVPTPAPEDLLLLLCVHASKHCWARLGWICDVGALISRHPQLNWEEVFAQASSLGSERMLHLGLSLARDLLRTALPTEASEKALADPVVRSLTAEVGEGLFRSAPDPQGDIEEKLAFYFQLRKRPRDKVEYVLRLLTMPTVSDVALLPLPAFVAWLYYPLRPIRLVGKYGRRLWKRPR